MPFNVSDKAVFSDIYRQLGPSLVAKVHYLVGSPELASELVHDVFLGLWGKGLTFSDQRAMFAWLYKSCHNRAIDHLRSGDHKYIDRNSQADEEALAKPCDADPESRLEQGQLLRQIARELSQEEATVLAYARIDGLEQIEISDLLGVSVRTIQRRLAAIDKKLRLMRESHLPNQPKPRSE